MASARGHLCSRLTISCEKRNSFLNHPLFSSVPSNFPTLRSLTFSANLSHAVLSRGYLSAAHTFYWPTRAPVVCMAKRYAPSTTKAMFGDYKPSLPLQNPPSKHRKEGVKKEEAF